MLGFLANAIGSSIWSWLTVIYPTTWLVSCHIKAKPIAEGSKTVLAKIVYQAKKRSDFYNVL